MGWFHAMIVEDVIQDLQPGNIPNRDRLGFGLQDGTLTVLDRGEITPQ